MAGHDLRSIFTTALLINSLRLIGTISLLMIFVISCEIGTVENPQVLQHSAFSGQSINKNSNTPQVTVKNPSSCEASKENETVVRPKNLELKRYYLCYQVLSDSLPEDNDPIVKLLSSPKTRNKKEVSPPGPIRTK
jgi:hypothetical protein